jgi:hypothetical protein
LAGRDGGRCLGALCAPHGAGAARPAAGHASPLGGPPILRSLRDDPRLAGLPVVAVGPGKPFRLGFARRPIRRSSAVRPWRRAWLRGSLQVSSPGHSVLAACREAPRLHFEDLRRIPIASVDFDSHQSELRAFGCRSDPVTVLENHLGAQRAVVLEGGGGRSTKIRESSSTGRSPVCVGSAASTTRTVWRTSG